MRHRRITKMTEDDIKMFKEFVKTLTTSERLEMLRLTAFARRLRLFLAAYVATERQAYAAQFVADLADASEEDFEIFVAALGEPPTTSSSEG